MKEGWLKILKPVTLEIAIFREKNQNFEWKTTLTRAGKAGCSRRPEGLRQALYLRGSIPTGMTLYYPSGPITGWAYKTNRDLLQTLAMRDGVLRDRSDVTK